MIQTGDVCTYRGGLQVTACEPVNPTDPPEEWVWVVGERDWDRLRVDETVTVAATICFSNARATVARCLVCSSNGRYGWIDVDRLTVQESDLIGSTIEAAAMRFAFGGNAP